MTSYLFKWACIGLITGTSGGIAATLFLVFLEKITLLREANTLLIFGLPIGGLFVGLLYHQYGKEVSKGHNALFEEIYHYNPSKIIPLRMAPMIFLGTLVTHLFGGSVGREGTVVQMSACLGDQLKRFFKFSVEEKKTLLVSAISAGIGAGIGTPWAGGLFGMELMNPVKNGKIKFFLNWRNLYPCYFASWVAYYTANLLKAPHSFYPPLSQAPIFSYKIFLMVVLVGIFFGLVAKVFLFLTHLFEKLSSTLVSYPPFRPFIFGSILVCFYVLEGSFFREGAFSLWQGPYRFAGLGLPVIQEAMTEILGLKDSLFKILFTAFTLGGGFKGGEFVPLVFVGATFGSALSAILPLSSAFLGRLGFVSVFAAVSKTPYSCALMAIELFGFKIALPAFISCLMSDFVVKFFDYLKFFLNKDKKQGQLQK